MNVLFVFNKCTLLSQQPKYTLARCHTHKYTKHRNEIIGGFYVIQIIKHKIFSAHHLASISKTLSNHISETNTCYKFSYKHNWEHTSVSLLFSTVCNAYVLFMCNLPLISELVKTGLNTKHSQCN
jgi:hypothetical protein